MDSVLELVKNITILKFTISLFKLVEQMADTAEVRPILHLRMEV
jgi:hypothetical protein